LNKLEEKTSKEDKTSLPQNKENISFGNKSLKQTKAEDLKKKKKKTNHLYHKRKRTSGCVIKNQNIENQKTSRIQKYFKGKRGDYY